MICRNCHKENTEGAKFCRSCGAKLGIEVRQASSSSEDSDYVPIPIQSRENPGRPLICRNCNMPNQPGMRFCRGCGASLENSYIRTENDTTVYDVPIPAPVPKKKGKVWLLILSLVVCLIVAAATVVLLVFNPFSSGKGEETTPSDGKENKNPFVITESVHETEPLSAQEFLNITDEPSVLNDNEKQTVEDKIVAKESKINVDIKIVIKAGITVKIEDFAKSNCTSQVGGNGIFVVIDTDKNQAAIATAGKGEDFVSKNTKTIISQDVPVYLNNKSYSHACEEIIDAILNEEKVSRFEAVEGAQQVVYVVKNSGSNTGKLTLVEWVDGEEEILYEIDKVYLGKDGITSSPSGTKSATPKGTFALGFAFSDHDLNTKLDKRLITSGDVWVDDPDSAYYNTLQHGSTSNSKWSSAENTYYAFSSGIFDACILIEHNGDGYSKGVSGKGSCIYISGKNKELSTSYGDVNISASQMETLLYYLDESKNPHIVIS